jgi:[1-hydroxy-2-(trimethylamino)ethyl]phosphonate dioxygenase
MPAASVDEIVAFYERHGGRHYDEDVSQRAHAEQTAALARAARATDDVVAAALLHDVGHLLEMAERDGSRDRSVDHRHESVGAAWLASLFGPGVTAPIALHVRAKRYLCAVEPQYHDGLSAGSVASLERQGGPLTADEVAAFEGNAGWEGAVALRRWDDQAKLVDLEVASIESYRPLLERVRRRGAGPACG